MGDVGGGAEEGVGGGDAAVVIGADGAELELGGPRVDSGSSYERCQ